MGLSRHCAPIRREDQGAIRSGIIYPWRVDIGARTPAYPWALSRWFSCDCPGSVTPPTVSPENQRGPDRRGVVFVSSFGTTGDGAAAGVTSSFRSS